MITRLLEPGEWLDRWYVLDRFAGSWGVVYVLRETERQEGDGPRPEIVIGKTLLPNWVNQPDKVERFERECYNWLRLGKYKHIVRLYTVDRFQKQPFAIGEFIPETLLPNTLRGWLDAHLVVPEIALRYGVQLCRALAFVRERGLLAHQDLKPENIMITPNGFIKVTDWGLSRLAPLNAVAQPVAADVPYHLKEERQDKEKRPYGTPGYAAPELYQPGARGTAEADMYSLGVILAEMLIGDLPPAGIRAADLAGCLPAVSEVTAVGLAEMITGCLSPDPASRLADLKELEKRLSAAFQELMGIPVEKPPYVEWQQPLDRTQQAYGFYMLGKVDEANELQSSAMREMNPPDKNSTGPAVTMVDYKEEGWKFVVPKELIDTAESAWQSDPADEEKAEHALNLNLMAGNAQRTLEISRHCFAHGLHTTKVFRYAYRAASKLGLNREAQDYLDKAIQQEPGNVELWLERTDFFEETGNLAEAVRSAEKIIQSDPGNAKAHRKLGHLFQLQGQSLKALHHLTEAVLYDPKDSASWYNLGTVYANQNNFYPAYQSLLKALEIDPEFPEALNMIGVSMLHLMMFQEAIPYLERAVAARPNSARPLFNLGQVYVQLGKDEQARALFEKAVKLDPNHQMARQALQSLRRGR